MNRFFADIKDGRVVINGSDAHHICDVLRLKRGDEIIVCSAGSDYYVTLESVASDSVCGTAEKSVFSDSESCVHITLYQGLPKGDKFETVIQKSTELGVYKIVPVEMNRCVAKLEPKKIQAKLQRWNKIACSAAKQSGRGIIPEVCAPLKVKNIPAGKHELFVIAYEEEKNTTLKQILTVNRSIKDIGILIGPEGGITPDEFEYLSSAGGKSVTLGSRILRTETAPIALLAMIFYELDM